MALETRVCPCGNTETQKLIQGNVAEPVGWAQVMLHTQPLTGSWVCSGCLRRIKAIMRRR